MPKCDFNKVALLRHECSPINLLHIFETPFPQKTSEGLLPSLVHGRLVFQSMIIVNC